MLVNSLIDQYLNTQDADLKYMALRQDIRIESVEDLQLLVGKVLLPILTTECNSEIVNLVSFQVFPGAVSKLVTSGNLTKNETQSSWFDNVVVLPLIQNTENNRSNFARQTLRNILKTILEMKLNELKYCNDEKSIEILLKHMEKIENSHDIGMNYLIVWEILNLLIQLYYNNGANMCKQVFVSILKLCSGEGDLTETMKYVLENSMKVVERRTLYDEDVMFLLQNKNILEIVSSVWYQLSFIVSDIFENNILPFLQLPDDLRDEQKEEIILKVLQSVYCLHEFYSTPRISTGTTYLAPEITECLQKSLLEIKSDMASIIAENFSIREAPTVEIETQPECAVDEDPNQAAYLEELQDDEERFEFEEDDNVEPPQDTIHERVIDLCETILDCLNSPSRVETLCQESGNEPEPEPASLEAAFRTLSTSSSLSGFQMAVELLNQTMYTAEKFNSSKTCKLLIPHMKQNKNFFRTIKVGNMTQTIDEGLTLRTMVYSTLLQIIAREERKNSIDYIVTCNIIKETVTRGIKDSDYTINDISLKILQLLLPKTYNRILGLDSEWYNETIHQKAITNIKKAYSRLETLSATEDTSSSISVIHQFESLFSSSYPAMK
ncbi:hypothetical protein HG535_0C04500 [Zygotorulaspora mrakii]|uniref:TATA-binding protein interacting (TIP20) domain-containing protein n=1 Tax=Zygotorulaspora mrakii TaxID=42260 RepID=A0A7H9B104_ZYGMR|nr:uncharacterized protein HG535_0C04500 [Zygotorulaspora mrakii]QLG72096.1 hypothetical protein HG535_0C04500 [Zygotorulaspora mrakii]